MFVQALLGFASQEHLMSGKAFLIVYLQLHSIPWAVFTRIPAASP